MFFFFFLMIRHPPRSTLFPNTPLFHSATRWRPTPSSRGPPLSPRGSGSSATSATRPTSSGSTSTTASMGSGTARGRSEEHTSELQSRQYLVCRLLLEKKKTQHNIRLHH